jgi:ABC-type methionine transport system ATPase subunit
MAIQNTNEFQATSEPVKSTTQLQTDRLTQTRVRVRIPKDLHEQPVISRLVSHHGVTVNITAALLSANAREDGWFDLELQGKASQIQSALTYLDEMDLEIWSPSTPEEEGW